MIILLILAGGVLGFLGWYLSLSAGSIGLIITGIGIFLILAGLIKFLTRGKKQPEENPEPAKELPEYRKKRTILSRAEWNFLQVLKNIVNSDKYEIDVQVPLVAVIDKLTQNSYRNELFRVVDFLIVDSTSYEPLLLIELNDSSHERADRAERDRKVIEICERAHMPLISFNPLESKDSAYVKKIILKNLKK